MVGEKGCFNGTDERGYGIDERGYGIDLRKGLRELRLPSACRPYEEEDAKGPAGLLQADVPKG